MIITKEQILVKRSGDFKEVSFGIREKDLSIVFATLRDLYSDSPLALVREYAANAYDSHLEAGRKDLPIEVTLPNRFHPVLEIKDEGLGLSEDDIFNIFVFYAASGDKRERDDTIGGFGIGGKSAFSYGDTFSVESIHNGFKYSYNAYIDESNLGKMALLHKEKTEEHNGVTIKIPVKPDDIPLFQKAAQRIFEFWPVKPNIKGLDVQWPDRKYILEGDNWGIYDFESRRSTVVVNHIPYDIRLDFLGYDYEAFKSLGMIFHFGYNDVEVSKNRENIKLTDKAKDSVRKRLDYIHETVSKEIKEKIANADSYIDAVKIYNDIFETDLHAKSFRSIIGDIKWENQIVRSEVPFDTYSGNRLYKVSYDKDENGRLKISKGIRSKDGWRNYTRRSYTPKSNNILVVTKDGAKETFLRGVIKEHPDKTIYLYSYASGDTEEFQKILDDYKPYILENFLPIRYKGKRGSRIGSAPKIRISDYKTFDGRIWSYDSTNRDFEDKNITYIRVDLFRNRMHVKGIHLLSKTEKRFQIIRAFINRKDLQGKVLFIGINKSDRSKFRKIKMVTIEEYYLSLLKHLRKHKKQFIFRNAVKSLSCDLDFYLMTRAGMLSYKGFLSKEGKRSFRLFKLLNNIQSNYLNKVDNLAQKLYPTAIRSRKEDIRKLNKEVEVWKEKHPILTNHVSGMNSKTIHLYVDLLEKELDKQAKSE